MSMLVAVDGESVPSEPVAVGAELARRFETELVVLHVMSQDLFDDFRDATTDRESALPLASEATYGGDGSAPGDSYTVDDGERNAAGVARDVVDGTLDDHDATVQGRVGEPVGEILDEADRRDATYLVIGGRKRTPVGKAVFGSTTQSLLLESDRPVMTVMRAE